MKTITITVTAKDVEQGSPWSASDCPLALAMDRLLPNHIVLVFEDEVRLRSLARRESIRLKPTPAMAAFVRRFDACESVEPKRFRFRVPDEVLS